MVPVLPFSRIRRVEEMFSARRKSVSSSRVVGKTLNSTGLRMYIATIMHHHRHHDVGDDQHVQHEAGQRRDQRDHDAQHGERHAQFSSRFEKRQPAQLPGQRARRSLLRVSS